MEMQTFLKGRRVGYWLSEKKMKKLNFQAFADLCRYVAMSNQNVICVADLNRNNVTVLCDVS